MRNLFNTINKLHKITEKQQGAALMVMLVILIVGISAILVSALNSTTVKIERDKISSQALAQAKSALIGRAIKDASHPGQFPCPDNHSPGDASEGTPSNSGSACFAYLGRLPWKTMGLADLRDSSGERLWYAVSSNFSDNVPINSNSPGMLQVYANDGTTLLTPPGSEAAAIIFAPGSIVGSQQRDAANQITASNYLDIGPNSRNNATSVGPFISADNSGTFNDRLMIITAQDVIQPVEMRVAKELNKAFTTYYSNNGNKYPYPGNISTCTSASCSADSTVCIGMVPFTTMSSVLTSMTWFKSNNWSDVVYYTAGTASLPGGSGGGGWSGGGSWKKGKKGGNSWNGSGGSGSTACTSTFLTLRDTDGTTLTNTANALFIMPDTPLGNITRTKITTSNLSDYFEDSENQNLDNIYVMPGGASNDLLYSLP